MINKLLKIFIVLLLFVIISCGQKSDDTNKEWVANQIEFLKENEQFKSKFEKTITNVFKENRLSGDFLLAVVNEKGLAYSFAINKNILSNIPSILNNNSPIYIASHTKSFTGTLLKILEDEGKIDLNKSVYEYLPELTFDDSIVTKQISVRQLLNHTHGIHSTQFTWKTAFLGYNGGNQELIEVLNADFLYDPSHKFRYSNTGPIIAAMIVEKILGNSWKDEMNKRIFSLFNMNNTSAYVSDYNNDEIRHAITMTKDNELFHSGFYKEDNTMHASGGIISTINDLTKWLQSNINHDYKLSENIWEEMHGTTTTQDRTYFTYKRNGYSLGWDIATYQNNAILTRFGGYAGISFHISFMPSKNIGIIAFSTDNRATYLPHLAANYAYNMINHSSDVENIYNNEKQLFDERFEKSSNRPLPLRDDRLLLNNDNDTLIGNYGNNLGWPDITIFQDDSTYTIKWGVLKGTIYNIPNPKQPYVGILGAVNRLFNVRNDSLFTGSLKYEKQ